MGTFLLWTDLCKVAIGGNLTSNFSIELEFFDVVASLLIIFDFSKVFMLESVLFRTVSIGNFFVMDQFTYSDNRM